MNSELYTTKACVICGKIMHNVGKAKRYCEDCHKKIIADNANLYYQRRKAKKKAAKPKDFYGDDSQCKTCIYCSSSAGYVMCGYADKAGHSRGCEPSPDCTKYERKKAR